MQEIQLPKKIGSYLLLHQINDVKWGSLFLSVKGSETKIEDYYIVGLLKDYYSDEIISYLNSIANQLRSISELFLWHPIEFYYESPYGIVVFPLFNAFSLEDVLKRAQDNVMPLTLDLVFLIYSRVLEGLNILHEVKIDDKRIIHGMAIPSNIFISIEGEVKLLHSGIFQCLIEKGNLCNELKENIKDYLSPEQQSNEIIGNRASDIYTLSVGLVECLSNKFIKEYEGKPYKEVVESLTIYSPSSDMIDAPQEIKDILAKALNEKPAERYKTAEEMRTTLDDYLFSSEFQPSTFNLAFYMNALYREDGAFINRLIEDAKKLDLTSYFVIPIVEEEKYEPEIISEQEIQEEVIELEATDVKEEKPEEVPAVEKPILFKTSEMRKEAVEPARKSFFLPIVIAIMIVVVGSATIYFLMRSGKIGTKPAELVSQQQGQVDLAQKLTAEQKRREEIEKKYEEERIALQQKIQELEQKLQQQLTDMEKKKAMEDIKKLQEMQKQKEELYTKEIASIEKEGEIASTKQKEELATRKGETEENAPSMQSKNVESGSQKAIQEKTPPEDKNAVADSSKGKVDETKPEVKEIFDSKASKPSSEMEPNKTQQPDTESKKFTVPSIVYANELDTPLVVIKEVKPEYPAIAKKQKIGGLVVLNLIVNTEGKVEKASVLKGHPLLSDAALEAAKEIWDC
jgi:serine/threonine protein kinase